VFIFVAKRIGFVTGSLLCPLTLLQNLNFCAASDLVSTIHCAFALISIYIILDRFCIVTDNNMFGKVQFGPVNLRRDWRSQG